MEESVDYAENLLNYKTVEFVLWSTFHRMLLQSIKHF